MDIITIKKENGKDIKETLIRVIYVEGEKFSPSFL